MSESRVAIIDSGGANIASLRFALQRLDCEATLTADPARIRGADRVILPGVGAARNAMDRLRQNKLLDIIRDLTQPVLGICLGMQLLVEASDEGDVACLGVMPGRAGRLPASPAHPVPNMGWCPVQKIASHSVVDGLENGSWFYFVHSYALPPGESTLATARHAQDFSAIIAHDNFVAAQFHPERSSVAGSRFLKNFLGWQP